MGIEKRVQVAWTDERVDTLKQLYSDGLSGGDIAAELGGITRNAVIGKVHRLGLTRRNGRSQAVKPATSRKPQRNRRTRYYSAWSTDG